jgi:hypothetical protein
MPSLRVDERYRLLAEVTRGRLVEEGPDTLIQSGPSQKGARDL